MTDKIKLKRTFFNSQLIITYLADGRINYYGTKRDYNNMPKDLSETATEFSYIKVNTKNYSKSKHHVVEIKRWYAKDYE